MGRGATRLRHVRDSGVPAFDERSRRNPGRLGWLVMTDAVAATGVSTNTDDAIHVTMPLRPELGSTLRVIAASLGADAGFSVDDIDDLRLAVSEVFTLLVEADEAVGARCITRFLVHDNVVEVVLTGTGVHDSESLALDPLAATILSSVVDEYSVDSDGVRLVKRAAESPPNDL